MLASGTLGIFSREDIACGEHSAKGGSLGPTLRVADVNGGNGAPPKADHTNRPNGAKGMPKK